MTLSCLYKRRSVPFVPFFMLPPSSLTIIMIRPTKKKRRENAFPEHFPTDSPVMLRQKGFETGPLSIWVSCLASNESTVVSHFSGLFQASGDLYH